MEEKDRTGGEEALLERIRQGDSRSFEALYNIYRGPVYSLARGMLQDAHAAQEVTQDVFLVIWRGAGGFDPRRGSGRSWILSLAHHKSVDAVRRQRMRATTPLSETIVNEVDVTEEAMRKVEGASVREALGALSGDQRVAIALAYYGGYTHQEVAARLGVPLGTVKTRIRDGLMRLRAVLGMALEERAR